MMIYAYSKRKPGNRSWGNLVFRSMYLFPESLCHSRSRAGLDRHVLVAMMIERNIPEIVSFATTSQWVVAETELEYYLGLPPCKSFHSPNMEG